MTTADFAGNILTILNDDCIYRVLEWLSLDDLCLLYQTCKRFQALCENHFLRKYPEEKYEIRARIGCDEIIYVEKYVKHFYKFANSVDIVWKIPDVNYRETLILSLVNLVKAKCDKNLHRISLEGNMELVQFCTEIRSFLRSVEIVQFFDRTESGRDDAEILAMCPKLIKLILVGTIHVNRMNAILQQRYQQLTHFHYINGHANNLNAEKLELFFQMNDKIQCVALHFDYAEGELMEQCVNALGYALRLEHLFFSIGSPMANCLDVVCNYLNVLCARDNFKSLEISFERVVGTTFLKTFGNQLANFKQLRVIHLTLIQLSDVVPALRTFVHLKVIVVHYLLTERNFNDWSDLHELSAIIDHARNFALNQVEEIHLGDVESEKKLLALVMLVVRHWANLKRIYAVADDEFNTTFDTSALNHARKNLRNASELTIFTDHKGNTQNLDQKLVKLKIVDFEFHVNRYPFQTHFRIKRQ